MILAHVLAEERFATTTPEETLGRVVAFFAPYAKSGGLAALGIASFGPLDLDQNLAHVWIHYHHAKAGLEPDRSLRRNTAKVRYPGGL